MYGAIQHNNTVMIALLSQGLLFPGRLMPTSQCLLITSLMVNEQDIWSGGGDEEQCMAVHY